MGIVSFTINLTVADKARWDQARKRRLWYPAKPPANGSAGPCGDHRIGSLIPVDDQMLDRWWTIHDNQEFPYGDLFTATGSVRPPEQVANEVIAAIRDHGIPWLKSRINALG